MNKIIFNLVIYGVCAGFMFCNPLQGLEWDSCCDCGDPDRFWADVEYICWQIKNSPKNVDLVKSGSKVILGGEENKNHWRSGGRFVMGYWLGEECCFGAEASYFCLPHESRSRSVHSNGSPGSQTLTIPYFDVTIPGESFTYLSLPGSFSGTATLKVANQMQGAELNGLIPLSCGCCGLDFIFLAGFRYWNFDEKLKFSTDSPNIDPPDVFKTNDKFHAENNFYGGQAGFELNYVYDCFSFNFKGKVALGAMCEEASIKGYLVTNDFDGFTDVQKFSGGYFALPTNIGHHKRTQFSLIPEADVTLGYQWSDCFAFHVGYTFLYVSNMLWATKELDRHINPTQSVAIAFVPDATLVGKARPHAQLKSENLWAQGVTAGFTYRF